MVNDIKICFYRVMIVYIKLMDFKIIIFLFLIIVLDFECGFIKGC